MKTPITDANVASLTKTPDCFCEASVARRLELDRAALMEAIENIVAVVGADRRPIAKAIKAIADLAAARANFPPSHP